MWSLASYSIIVTVLLIAAIYDIGWRQIPNALPFCLLAVGIVIHLVDHRLAIAATSALVVFTVCLAAWVFSLLGGGDVKLLAAVTFATPVHNVGSLILVVALIGGLLSLGYMMLSKVLPVVSPVRPLTYVRRILRTEHRRIVRRLSLPYGVAIALGSIVTMSVG